MKARALPLVVALLCLPSCKSTDPYYCDAETPCSDLERSFCDIDGTFEGSNGLGNTCVPEPPVESCNRIETCASDARPHCNGAGECVECLASGHCPDATPVCSLETYTCKSCVDTDDGDIACAAAFPDRPLCADEGECVQCLGASDCGDTTPVCDDAARSCRACLAHDECPSLVCERMIGSCVPGAAVIYVDPAGSDGASCGTADQPCATLGAGLALTTPTRRTVRLAAGTYDDTITLDSGVVRVIGVDGAVLRPAITDATDAVTVTGTASLSLQNVDLDGGATAAGSSALRCTGSAAETPSLSVEDAVVRGFRAMGVSVEACNLTLRRSIVELNQGGGVEVTDGDYSIVNSVIANNGSAGVLGSQRGGVWLAQTLGHTQSFEFNTIVGNLAASGAPDVASGITCTASNATLRSSILRLRGGGGGNGLRSGDCAFTYSDVEGGAAGVGNIDVEPLLVNPAASDYHLQPSSPARDAAEPTAVTPVDFEGDPRPVGPAADMGADEITTGS